MKHKLLLVGLIASCCLGIIFTLIPGQLPLRYMATAQAPPLTEFDRVIGQNAQRMIDEGRRIFRFDTFGSEAGGATR